MSKVWQVIDRLKVFHGRFSKFSLTIHYISILSNMTATAVARQFPLKQHPSLLYAPHIEKVSVKCRDIHAFAHFPVLQEYPITVLSIVAWLK